MQVNGFLSFTFLFTLRRMQVGFLSFSLSYSLRMMQVNGFLSFSLLFTFRRMQVEFFSSFFLPAAPVRPPGATCARWSEIPA